MFLARVLSALVLIPIVVALVYLGGYPFLVLVLLAAAVGVYEFVSMVRRAGFQPFLVLGMLAALLFVAAAGFPDRDLAAPILTGAILTTLGSALFLSRPPAQVALDCAITLFAALYAGWLVSYGLILRLSPEGLQWTIAALVATWAADTGAYLAGRAIGRHRLIPRISPSKTWEGLVGGGVLAVVAAVLTGEAMLELALWQSLLLGACISIAAVAGDLAESLLKRAAAVKDSGSLVPGHGGLLDRLDSLLFVFPVVYYFRLWV